MNQIKEWTNKKSEGVKIDNVNIVNVIFVAKDIYVLFTDIG